jgi:hypothetical protein
MVNIGLIYIWLKQTATGSTHQSSMFAYLAKYQLDIYIFRSHRFSHSGLKIGACLG